MLFQNLKRNFKNFDITFNLGELHLKNFLGARQKIYNEFINM